MLAPSLALQPSSPELTAEAPVAPPSEAARKRRVLLVAGMHRSGTSAVTRLLSLLGAELPRTLVPADRFNERGYWEPLPIVELDREMLAAAGVGRMEVTPIPLAWFDSADAMAFEGCAVELIEQEYPEGSLVVLKDPHLARLLPFWLRVLKKRAVEPGVVIPFRNPLEVAHSMAARASSRGDRSVSSGIGAQGGLLWLRHVIDAERGSRGVSRCFVNYADLLRSPLDESERMARELGLEWPRNDEATRSVIELELTQKLRHQTFEDAELESSADTTPWVKRAYAALLRGGDFEAEFDAIGEELERADLAYYPLLVEAHARQAELRATLGALQHTLSWRVTTPLRAARRAAGPLLRWLRQ